VASFWDLLRGPKPACCTPLCMRHQQGLADVDQVVGEHAEPDPPFHALRSVIQTTPQPMPPFGHADTPFAARAPALSLLEPAAPLQLLALRTARVAIRHCHPLHTQFLDRLLLRLRIISRIRRHQSWHAPEFLLVLRHGA
jgi:hypothetical protein